MPQVCALKFSCMITDTIPYHHGHEVTNFAGFKAALGLKAVGLQDPKLRAHVEECSNCWTKVKPAVDLKSIQLKALQAACKKQLTAAEKANKNEDKLGACMKEKVLQATRRLCRNECKALKGTVKKQEVDSMLPLMIMERHNNRRFENFL